jgi:hypothetical protein
MIEPTKSTNNNNNTTHSTPRQNTRASTRYQPPIRHRRSRQSGGGDRHVSNWTHKLITSRLTTQRDAEHLLASTSEDVINTKTLQSDKKPATNNAPEQLKKKEPTKPSKSTWQPALFRPWRPSSRVSPPHPFQSSKANQHIHN